MYYENKHELIGLINIIKKINDEIFWIPLDELNLDYQEYLTWIAQGNTPEEWNNGL